MMRRGSVTIASSILRSVSAWVRRQLLLGTPLRGKSDAAELSQLASETHRLGAEAACGSALIDQSCIEERNGESREHDVVVDRESRYGSRQRQRANTCRVSSVLGRERGELRLGREHRAGGWSQGGSRCFHG